MKKTITTFLLASLFLSGFAQLSRDQSAQQNPVQVDKGKYLLRTLWDQWGIYAKYTPDQHVLGCWSTALAQILYYHKLKPTGSVDYTCTKGYIIRDDLSNYPVNWKNFKDSLDQSSDKENIESVARYTYLTAAAVRKDFGTEKYLELVNPAPQVEKHFACKAEFYVCFSGDVPFTQAQLKDIAKKESIRHIIGPDSVKMLIEKEIDHKRPVYFHFGNFSSYGHSTVIDGYQKQGATFYVHINYGASGFRNGWYDILKPIDVADDIRLRAFVTIRPLN